MFSRRYAEIPKLCLLLLILWLLSPENGFAREWQLDTDSDLGQEHQKELMTQFPSIPDSETLVALLRAIGHREAMSRVEAWDDSDGKITIHASKASTISTIELISFTRKLRFEIESKLSKYVGQSASSELRLQIENETKTILRNQGYFLAKISLEENKFDNHVSYQISIKDDYPCTVSRFDLSFKLPVGIKNPLERGLYCNLDEIKILINNIETQLLEAGFNQQRISNPEIIYDSSSNTAIVKIGGNLGKKVRATVRSPIKPPALIGLIFGDELNSIDQSITDPDAMASDLSRQYRAKGYDDVVVSPGKIINSSEDVLEYSFEINPGVEYRITDVQFEGAVAITPDEAIGAMQLYPSFGNTPSYSPEITRVARDSLLNFYKEQGFWDAKIFDPRVIKNPGTGEVRLVYVVREGKRRIFESLEIKGNQDISSDQISDLLAIDKGDSLAWQQLSNFEKEIRRTYRNKGYLNVQLNLDLVQNRQFRDIQTVVVVRISEGARSKFGPIYIKGLVKTKNLVVTRELRFKQGDWFDPNLIEQSRQALIDLGLFSSVSISPSDENPENLNQISYSVLLREARAGSVGFGPGWSEEGMRFSVEGSYNNIGGTGRKIFSKGVINQEKDQKPLGTKTLLGRYAGVGYVEPYLFQYPVDGIISFNHKALAQVNSWEISRSAEATAIHKIRGFSPKSQIEAFTLYKESREEAAGNVKAATLTDSGNLQIRELGMRHVSDARNNIAWPTRGYRLNTELSFADFLFGGGLKYTKWSIGYSAYQELFTNLVAAVGVSYTSYDHVERIEGIHVLPSTERLSTGGSESNRGFRENTLGPVFIAEDGTKIFDGGSRRGQNKVELRYQLIVDTLAISLFFDSSNSSFSLTEEKNIQKEFAKIQSSSGTSPRLEDNESYPFETAISHPQYLWTKNYVSYGSSLNLLTPLGAVNVSLGWPWRRCLNNQETCKNPRGNSAFRQLRGATLGLNIGANF